MKQITKQKKKKKKLNSSKLYAFADDKFNVAKNWNLFAEEKKTFRTLPRHSL